jgi:four helix bundle protein
MGFQSVENLQVWQKSKMLCIIIYKHLKTSSEFWIKDQMLRSALSVPSNIAEGYDRNSIKDTIRFFNIAQGSLSELKTQVIIATELNIINQQDAQNLIQEIDIIASMLYKLIKVKQSALQS